MQIRPLQEELSTVVVEARQLEDEQENARKQLRELVRRRQELEHRGEEARRRLAALLRGTFGFKSEELIPFGLNPLPRNRAASSRRKKKAEADKAGKPAEPAAS